MVGRNSIDFFRAIQRSEAVPSFYMDDRDVKLYSRQRSRQCGVRIPIHKQSIRLLLHKNFLNSYQHLGRHLRMGTT